MCERAGVPLLYTDKVFLMDPFFHTLLTRKPSTQGRMRQKGHGAGSTREVAMQEDEGEDDDVGSDAHPT